MPCNPKVNYKSQLSCRPFTRSPAYGEELFKHSSAFHMSQGRENAHGNLHKWYPESYCVVLP